MSNRSHQFAPAFLSLATAMLTATPALAGSWQSNAPFGTTMKGDLYTPTTPAASPAIIVAIHYCGGNSSNAHGWFQSAADQYGFYIIAPNAGNNCFDSSASRGGDRADIVKMVDYVITNKNADKTRVFAAGYSSGGCMTNTLLAIYPDVFAGGSALPGYPAGAWPSGDTSCQLCGNASKPDSSDTGQKYATLVKGVFSWSGARPCVQQFVGGADEYHFAQWLPVVASEFQILGNLSDGTSGSGAPSGWTRTEYKDSSGRVMLQTNLGPSGQKHDLTSAGLNGQVISFLGLDKPTGACGSTASGTGGAGGAGPTTGGAANGGASAITPGGRPNIGGASNSASGRGNSTGGAVVGAGGQTGSVGSTKTGGAANNGGAAPNGGTANVGGKTTSGTANGGTPSAGGKSSSVANNGGSESGGTSSVDPGKGGAATSSSTSTSAPSSGGASTGNGGTNTNNSTNGTGDASSTSPVSPPVDSGCGCRVNSGVQPSGAILGLFLAGIGMLVRRRRRADV